MKRICVEIGDIAPICSTIAEAAEEQRSTINDLAGRMSNAQIAVTGVTNTVQSIHQMTTDANAISQTAGQLSEVAALDAKNLGRRVVTILRTMSAADRRMHERFPIDLALRVRTGGDMLACRSFDVSEGGLLLKPQDKLHLSVGTTYDAEISQVGSVKLRVVNVSPIGTHCAFAGITTEVWASLSRTIDTFKHEHAPLIERARAMASEICASIESEVSTKRLGLSAVFDTDYQKIPDTDPVQFKTLYLERFDTILPTILERNLRLDPSMAFCLAIDRNGYIPVHNQKVSQPQRKGDTKWNTANCRNRRIFDDRAGLLAGRLMRPYLIQTYNRDMGNGVQIQMKEVDVPLVILGRHWGGIRMAYAL